MARILGEVNGKAWENSFIEVTERAANEIAKILEKNGATSLRIGVKGGGCSGMEYIIQLEGRPHPTDIVFKGLATIGDRETEFIIVIDPKSTIYINGTEIDWETFNLSPRLVFKNPNAKSSCSCGLSFDPGIKK
jgi:iron-sulfur cluster assembly protein